MKGGREDLPYAVSLPRGPQQPGLGLVEASSKHLLQIFHVAVGPKALGLGDPPLLSQGIGWEPECKCSSQVLKRLASVPTRDAIIIGGNLTCYATMPAPNIFLVFPFQKLFLLCYQTLLIYLQHWKKFSCNCLGKDVADSFLSSHLHSPPFSSHCHCKSSGVEATWASSYPLLQVYSTLLRCRVKSAEVGQLSTTPKWNFLYTLWAAFILGAWITHVQNNLFRREIFMHSCPPWTNWRLDFFRLVSNVLCFFIIMA